MGHPTNVILNLVLTDAERAEFEDAPDFSRLYSLLLLGLVREARLASLEELDATAQAG
jgi:hypothetical protein